MFQISMTGILPYAINSKQDAWISAMVALILVFSGFLLILFIVINISILGVSEYERSNYPLLVSVGYINIVDFIQRLDSFIVIFMVCGVFIKIAIFLYCVIFNTAEIFNVKKSDQLIYPISLIIVICSIIMARNYAEHIHKRIEIIPYLLHVPIQIIIPICLLIIALIQKKMKAKI
ncbi:GerAB/ArcD/ProY family transporter [Gottfriedia luciferensis]|uniref:GerAB/ArcD/ProY family transporter n=1 Tax=Gottfriedia luciferensis TaxID=178774 RepID=UPI000B452599|nr:GerAB/ArcD/ProY family transporter [Gottfriedia luciferensis]